MNKERLGKAVKTLRELKQLAVKRRSVVCPKLHAWSQRKPAAFIMNLQGEVILRLLNSGLYVYRKKEQ